MNSRFLITIALVIIGSNTFASTIEKPVYAKFTDRPSDQNPVSGYVLFGQLSDGTPAVQKINQTTVRFYERAILFVPSDLKDWAAAQELNCKTGMLQVIGMGPLEQIKMLENPPRANHVKNGHPKNLSVYREVCTVVGLQPSW